MTLSLVFCFVFVKRFFFNTNTHSHIVEKQLVVNVLKKSGCNFSLCSEKHPTESSAEVYLQLGLALFAAVSGPLKTHGSHGALGALLSILSLSPGPGKGFLLP